MLTFFRSTFWRIARSAPLLISASTLFPQHVFEYVEKCAVSDLGFDPIACRARPRAVAACIDDSSEAFSVAYGASQGSSRHVVAMFVPLQFPTKITKCFTNVLE